MKNDFVINKSILLIIFNLFFLVSLKPNENSNNAEEKYKNIENVYKNLINKDLNLNGNKKKDSNSKKIESIECYFYSIENYLNSLVDKFIEKAPSRYIPIKTEIKYCNQSSTKINDQGKSITKNKNIPVYVNEKIDYKELLKKIINEIKDIKKLNNYTDGSNFNCLDDNYELKEQIYNLYKFKEEKEKEFNSYVWSEFWKNNVSLWTMFKYSDLVKAFTAITSISISYGIYSLYRFFSYKKNKKDSIYNCNK
jgi:hypothetical protein